MPSSQSIPGLVEMVAALARRIRALETQQNWGITDGTGKLRIRGGLQPDGTYGIWMLDPTTGNPVLKMTGTLLELLTSSGHELVKLDDTGQTVYDTSGNIRTELGLLSNGDYGLLVADPTSGQKTEILPVYTAEATATVTTTTHTSWVDLGGPSVTATIGASGKCLITFSAFSSISSSTTAGIGAFVGIGLDGGTPPSGGGKPNAGFVTTAVKLGVTTANSFVMSTTAGSHTFKMWYFAQKVDALFSGRFIQVRPL